MEEADRQGSQRADPPLQGYPWAVEQEALRALEGMEVDRCRNALYRLAEQLRPPTGTEAGVVGLLLCELLVRLRLTLQPMVDPAVGQPAGETAPEWEPGPRLRRAERMSGAGDLAGLRTAFLAEVDDLFAPLAASAGLSPGVLRARGFLDRHFTRRVSLQELAEAVHLSPNYLSSIFRREMGMTVTGYLRRRRTRRAEQMLLEGKHTISEVAYLVGFQNYRDFHRNFVRSGGRSPRAFQRLCRTRRDSLGPPPE